MGQFLAETFTGQTPGAVPTSWTVGTGAAVINASTDVHGVGVVCYHAAAESLCWKNKTTPVTTGIVNLSFYYRVAEFPIGIEYCMISAQGSTPHPRICELWIKAGGALVYVDSTGEHAVATISVDTWYQGTFRIYLDDGTFDFAHNGVDKVLGAAFMEVSADYKLIDFGSPAGVHLRFDDVYGTTEDVEAAAPTRCSLATAFRSDTSAVTMTSYTPAGTTPNRSSAYTDANALQMDSLNRYAETANAGDGVHYWQIDFGSAVAPDFLAVIGHNFETIAGTGTPNFALWLQATTDPAAWAYPSFELDITSRKNEDPLIAFIPASTSYRYWRLAIYSSGISNPAAWRVGRMILDDGLFTPAHSFSEPYEVSRVDPSALSDTEGRAVVGRARTPYRAVSFGWGASNPLSIADQDDLDEMLVSGAGGKAWVAMLDPANRLEKMTIYGTMRRETRFSRVVSDLGSVDFEIREIVT